MVYLDHFSPVLNIKHAFCREVSFFIDDNEIKFTRFSRCCFVTIVFLWAQHPAFNIGHTDCSPANTKHLYNICTTSVQRLRRWTNIVQLLYKCLVFTGWLAHSVEPARDISYVVSDAIPYRRRCPGTKGFIPIHNRAGVNEQSLHAFIIAWMASPGLVRYLLVWCGIKQHQACRASSQSSDLYHLHVINVWLNPLMLAATRAGGLLPW